MCGWLTCIHLELLSAHLITNASGQLPSHLPTDGIWGLNPIDNIRWLESVLVGLEQLITNTYTNDVSVRGEPEMQLDDGFLPR